jgi:hypothetical protein
MIGKIFITRTGYDPQLGKHVKDPYLDGKPSLGACRPDIRRVVVPGDQIFVISGKVRDANQFIMCAFEVESKIDARKAYRLFPERRLRVLEDGQLDGNIIIDSRGRKHPLDTHDGFERRIENYVVGTNAISFMSPEEIARARSETLEILCDIFQRRGLSPIDVVGRWGSTLTEDQAIRLREHLNKLKEAK